METKTHKTKKIEISLNQIKTQTLANLLNHAKVLKWFKICSLNTSKWSSQSQLLSDCSIKIMTIKNNEQVKGIEERKYKIQEFLWKFDTTPLSYSSKLFKNTSLHLFYCDTNLYTYKPSFTSSHLKLKKFPPLVTP